MHMCMHMHMCMCMYMTCACACMHVHVLVIPCEVCGRWGLRVRRPPRAGYSCGPSHQACGLKGPMVSHTLRRLSSRSSWTCIACMLLSSFLRALDHTRRSSRSSASEAARAALVRTSSQLGVEL